LSAPEVVDDGALYKFTFYLLFTYSSCNPSSNPSPSKVHDDVRVGG